ncbi:MAG: acylphosphatase [Elusimicrobia bacterium]|nr:acylphosphatase [Elusimicrobiota bacterium]
MTRLHWVVHGRVQGVGYRWFAREAAERLGVVGWVSNRTDGSVEGEAEGDEAAVKEFVELLERGPAFARVDHFETKAVEGRGNASDFEIR